MKVAFWKQPKQIVHLDLVAMSLIKLQQTLFIISTYQILPLQQMFAQ